MTQTASGPTVLALARAVGAIDYEMLSGRPTTSKVARLRLPDGRPLVIQINNKTARIWMRPDDERGLLRPLGAREEYACGRRRHHHLAQVREFVGQALVKVACETTDTDAIRSAFIALRGAPRSVAGPVVTRDRAYHQGTVFPCSFPTTPTLSAARSLVQLHRAKSKDQYRLCIQSSPLQPSRLQATAAPRHSHRSPTSSLLTEARPFWTIP